MNTLCVNNAATLDAGLVDPNCKRYYNSVFTNGTIDDIKSLCDAIKTADFHEI